MKKIVNYTELTEKLLKENNLTVNCIIPAYNEASRIGTVLDIVLKYPLFKDVTVVVNGCTDNTLEETRKFSHYTHLKIIDYFPGYGKTHAILTGVNATSGDLLMFIDADLKGLTNENISKLIYFVINKQFDMTILDRAGDRRRPIGIANSLFGRFLGGERVLSRKHFLEANIEQDARWGLEQHLNMFFLKNQLKVRTIYADNIDCVYQFEKKGFIGGMKEWNKMSKDLASKTDLKGFFLQVGNIEEDRLEPLYKFYQKTNKNLRALPMTLLILGGLFLSVGSFLFLNTKYIYNKTKKNKTKKIEETF
jgi:glycosyltransferase involved in cell wall biosynthesis